MFPLGKVNKWSPMVNSTTFRKSVFALSGLLFGTIGFTQTPNSPKEKSTKAIIKSTARFHTIGMFSYGGRIAGTNPALDVNIIYEYKTVGLQIFKSLDISERTSASNFMLAALYKNFKLGKKLTFTPQIAAAFEQQHSFAGHGSDLGFITITTFKLNQFFAIDHTMFVGDLVVHPNSRDWVNRVRLLFSSRHVDITTSLWHNNNLFDDDNYASGAITIGYNRIKVSDHFNLNFAVTDIAIMQSSDENNYPSENNLVFTTAIQFIR
jgi:hypothetical protein